MNSARVRDQILPGFLGGTLFALFIFCYYSEIWNMRYFVGFAGIAAVTIPVLCLRERLKPQTFSLIVNGSGIALNLVMGGLIFGSGLRQPPTTAFQLFSLDKTWLLFIWLALETLTFGDMLLRMYTRHEEAGREMRHSLTAFPNGIFLGGLMSSPVLLWFPQVVGIGIFPLVFVAINTAGVMQFVSATESPSLVVSPEPRQPIPTKREENLYTFIFLAVTFFGWIFVLFFDKRVLSLPMDWTWIVVVTCVSAIGWKRLWSHYTWRDQLYFHIASLCAFLVLMSIPNLIFVVKGSPVFLIVGGVMLGGCLTGFFFYFQARVPRGGNLGFAISSFTLGFLLLYLSVQVGLLLSTDTWPGYIPWIMGFIVPVLWAFRGVWIVLILVSIWLIKNPGTGELTPCESNSKKRKSTIPPDLASNVNHSTPIAPPKEALPLNWDRKSKAIFLALVCVASCCVTVPPALASAGTQVVGRQTGSHCLWLNYPLERVDPYQVPPDAAITPVNPEISLSMARNEYEPFQIVVSSLSTRHLVVGEVKTSDLHHTENASAFLPASSISIHIGEYVLGAYLDVLAESENGGQIHETNRNFPLVFTVYCPGNAPSGEYQGTLTIPVGGAIHEVDLQLTVWNFTIPVTRHLRTTYNSRSMDPDTPMLRQSFWNHRVSPYAEVEIPYLKHSHDTGEVNFNFSATWQADMEQAFAQGMNLFRIDNGGLRQACVKSNYAEINVTIFQNYFRGVVQELQNHTYAGLTWLDYGFVYLWDEPTPDDYVHVERLADLIHAVSSDIKVFIPTQSGSLPNAVEKKIDIWAPMLVYDFDWAQIERRWEAGLENWFYICVGSDFPLFNHWIHTPLLSNRLVFWYAWKNRLDGYLFWAVDFAEDYKQGIGFNGFGDGVLIYPGPDGNYAEPVESYRWEMVRQGLEDFEYFWYLKVLSEDLLPSDNPSCAEARALGNRVREIIRDKADWNPDPDVLNELRVDIGEFLHGISKQVNLNSLA